MQLRLYKEFSILTKTLLIGAFLSLCHVYAMEGDEKESKDPNVSPLSEGELAEIESYLNHLSNASEMAGLFNKLRGMRNSMEKVGAYEKIITTLKGFALLDPSIFPQEAREMSRDLMLKSELGKAETLFVLALQDHKAEENEASIEKKIQLLTSNLERFRICREIYTRYECVENIKTAAQYEASCLYRLAFAYGDAMTKSIHGESLIDIGSILENNEQTLRCMRECYEVKASMKFDSKLKGADLDMIHSGGLAVCMKVFLSAESTCKEIFGKIEAKTVEAKEVIALWASAQHLLKMAQFISTYYIDSDCVDFNAPQMLEMRQSMFQSLKESSIRDSKSRIRSRQVLANLPMLVDKLGINLYNPIHFRTALFTSYFKAVMKASQAMSLLAEGCQDHRKRDFYNKAAKEYKDAAIHAYKKHLYKGEYACDPESEQAFILARLSDLVGEGHPLIDFYKKLHRKRLDRKKQAREQKLQAKQLRAQTIRAEMEQRRAQQELAQQEEATAPQAAVLVKQKPRPSEPSYEPFETIKGQEKEVKVSAVVSKREQRRLDKSEQPQDDVGLIEEDIELSVEEEPVIIFLDTNNYNTFCCLTGLTQDRNVPLPDVLKLLAKLGCKVEHGARHRKVMAPRGGARGGAWTVPPEWDGPIPAPYRAELNEFIQNIMDIDPQNIQKKSK